MIGRAHKTADPVRNTFCYCAESLWNKSFAFIRNPSTSRKTFAINLRSQHLKYQSTTCHRFYYIINYQDIIRHTYFLSTADEGFHRAVSPKTLSTSKIDQIANKPKNIFISFCILTGILSTPSIGCTYIDRRYEYYIKILSGYSNIYFELFKGEKSTLEFSLNMEVNCSQSFISKSKLHKSLDPFPS